MKDTGNTAIDEPEPEVKSNLATPQDMMNVQNDLGVLQHEIVRMREEEKKWMAHYQKLQVAAEQKKLQAK